MRNFIVRDKRIKNRFFIDNWFFDSGIAAQIKPYAQSVYFALCRYANHDDQRAFPKNETLAADCGFTVRQVQRALKILANFNMIEVVINKAEGNHREIFLLDLTVWKTQAPAAQVQTPPKTAPQPEQQPKSNALIWLEKALSAKPYNYDSETINDTLQRLKTLADEKQIVHAIDRLTFLVNKGDIQKADVFIGKADSLLFQNGICKLNVNGYVPSWQKPKPPPPTQPIENVQYSPEEIAQMQADARKKAGLR